MSKKRAATSGELGDLHNMIAKYFKARLIESDPNREFTEDEMDVDEETGELVKPFVMPMQGTEIGHIIAFLRNNDITAEPDDESLNDLKGEFTEDYELRRKAKADKILSMSKEETEQQNWI